MIRQKHRTITLPVSVDDAAAIKEAVETDTLTLRQARDCVAIIDAVYFPKISKHRWPVTEFALAALVLALFVLALLALSPGG